MSKQLLNEKMSKGKALKLYNSVKTEFCNMSNDVEKRTLLNNLDKIEKAMTKGSAGKIGLALGLLAAAGGAYAAYSAHVHGSDAEHEMSGIRDMDQIENPVTDQLEPEATAKTVPVFKNRETGKYFLNPKDYTMDKYKKIKAYRADGKWVGREQFEKISKNLKGINTQRALNNARIMKQGIQYDQAAKRIKEYNQNNIIKRDMLSNLVNKYHNKQNAGIATGVIGGIIAAGSNLLKGGDRTEITKAKAIVGSMKKYISKVKPGKQKCADFDKKFKHYFI